MNKLLSFEFEKKWKNNKIFLLSLILFQVISIIFFAITINSQTPTVTNPFIGLIAFLYLLSLAALIIYPYIENIFRFNNDISGKQSVLELSIPMQSWKKILSKLIVSMCSIIISTLIAAVSVFILVIIFMIKTNKTNEVMQALNKALNLIHITPYNVGILIILIFCSFVLQLLVIFFCIAVAKSITHKNKIAVPIGFGVYIAYSIVTGILSDLIMKSQFAVITDFKISVLNIILEIVFFALAFWGTSWLVENKIES